MPKKTENQSGQTDNQEIMFKCKFCGETKPLSEMVLMRQYFPQIAACKSCSRTPITEVEVQTTE
jgi:transcription elongation factor Elf1